MALPDLPFHPIHALSQRPVLVKGQRHLHKPLTTPGKQYGYTVYTLPNEASKA